MLAGLPLVRGAHAQAADKATAFIKATGDKLVAAVNGAGTAAEKRQRLTQVIDATVDVDGVGKFCLGRFWRQASPDQQKRYLELFHQVLVTSITAKIGDYQGVHFTMGRSRMESDHAVVSTTVERPNNPPTAVDWIIEQPSGDPRIIDVVAEGTSLRLTQRSDYASYLSHNNNSIDALIKAMHDQVAKEG
ncbi:MAG TPA: ABC transporter substrate-binding protein [Acetobacteraceae bacterium]